MNKHGKTTKVSLGVQISIMSFTRNHSKILDVSEGEQLCHGAGAIHTPGEVVALPQFLLFQGRTCATESLHVKSVHNGMVVRQSVLFNLCLFTARTIFCACIPTSSVANFSEDIFFAILWHSVSDTTLTKRSTSKLPPNMWMSLSGWHRQQVARQVTVGC